ncbi:MAG: PEP-CTERM sorting domain-containing protein [Planctomycetes bacterium]|nr:PEP-CTERM sorting domain-containing protein [Planctomycetota bacterium]
MKTLNKTKLAVAAGMAMGLASFASAGPLVTFTYTNLSGQYAYNAVGDTGQFKATAVSAGALQTDGSVSLVTGPGAGTAVFNPGFTSRTIADFQIDISFFGRVGNMASGNGSFMAKDIFGNTLTGQLAGDWVMFGGAVFFNGAIRGAVFTPTPYAVLPFTGENQTQFGMGGPMAVQPLDGSIVQIFLATPPNSQMDNDFRLVSTGVAGQLVPTPASMALMGLGGLIAARRRRN